MSDKPLNQAGVWAVRLLVLAAVALLVLSVVL